MRTPRLGFMVTFVAGGVALAFSAAAYACVVYKGSFTVSQGTRAATNVGKNSYHGLCYDNGSVGIDVLSEDKVVLETRPFARHGNCPASQLPQGTYSVRMGGGAMVSQCMNGGSLAPAHVVDSSGYGQTIVEPLAFVPTETTVCLISHDLYAGMEMSFFIL